MKIVLIYLVMSVLRSPAQPPAPLSLTFVNRHESTQIDLYDQNGGERADAVKQMSRFVRCWRTGRVKQMDPRLLQVISQVARHFDNAQIDVVSGFRARPYGAPHSKHFLGRAMDIRVQGVPARTVRDFVWRNFRGIGTGLYPEQDFVHIDVREMDTGWVDHAQHGESARGLKVFVRPESEPVRPAPPAAQTDMVAAR